MAESQHPQRPNLVMTCRYWTCRGSVRLPNSSITFASRGVCHSAADLHAHVPLSVHCPQGIPDYPWRRGGPVMAILSSRFLPEPGAAQVWSQLDADLRHRAIAVVAQMAFNFVKTQSVRAQQEADDAHTTQLSQAPQYPFDPSRARLRPPVHAHAGPHQYGEHGAPVPPRHPGP